MITPTEREALLKARNLINEFALNRSIVASTKQVGNSWDPRGLINKVVLQIPIEKTITSIVLEDL